MYRMLLIDNQKNINGGPLYGTQYDLSNSCSECGSGAIPTGPRYLKLKQIPKQMIFMTLDREILLSKKIADELRSLGESFLVDVIDVNTKKNLPLWELRAEATLPKFLSHSFNFEKEGSCEKCQRDGYFGIPHKAMKLKYHKSTFLSQKFHVLETYELFGNSRIRNPFKESVFASPLFILSDVFQNILIELKIPGISFEDIELE